MCAAPASIFKGNFALALPASGSEHQSGLRQASGAIDPSVTAFDAPAGSVYQSTLTGKLYIKTDAGLSTNWLNIQTYPSQCVEVAKIGGEQSSIQAAINSVTDATASKIYAIHIHEGVWVEDITMKPFVVLIGVANGPAAPTIQGKITANFTNPGEFSLINRMQQVYTIASDNDRAIDVTGGLLVNDFFSNVTCSADYNYNAFYLNGTTFPCILYSGTLTVTNTFDGSTKTQIGVYQTGPTDTIDYAFYANMHTKASSGFVACRQIATTGASQVDSDGNKFSINNIKAGSTAEFAGTFVSTATTGFRLSKNDQVRITGTGGGTASLVKLNSGGNSAKFFTAGLVGFIDSTFTGQVTDTATGDTQEVWLNSTNRNLVKSGAGLAIITPYDLVNSGFSQWSTVGATYWSYVPGTRVFTLNKRFTGVVLSAPVVAADSQTVTCTNNQVNYIYADDNGVLQVTQTPSAALYSSGIPVFQLYSDGTNFRVKKENHPVSWPTSVSQFIHKMFGSALENNGGGTISTLVAASRTVQLIGATTAVDHGLETTIPDSTGVALTWTGAYTAASGMAWDAAALNVTAIPSKWQNTGTTIANAANNDRIVVRCGVILDNLNSSAPQYVFSYHSAVYGSNAAAASAIAAGSILDFPASLYGMEIVQIGYVTIQANGSGGGTIVATTPAKKVLGQIFTGGAASSSASLNLTDTTTFDGQLSGAETTTQVAFNRIDDYGYIPTWSATKNAAPATYRIGNPVIQNGCLYVCSVAHTASTFAADRANWTQHSIARYPSVVAAEAANANDGDLSYVAATDTFYKYVAAGSAYTRDGTYVLNTGDAGNTRRIGVAGRYIVGTVNNLSTDANILPTGTTAQRPTATEGATRFNSSVSRLETADGSVFRAVALAQDRSITNYIKRVEFDVATGATLSSVGWSGTAAITATRTLADLPRELTSGVGVRIGLAAGDIATYAFTLDDVDLNRVLQAVADVNVKAGTDILMTVKDGATTLGSVTLLAGFSTPQLDFVTASNAALTLNFSSAAGGTVIISDTSVSAGKLVSGPQVSDVMAYVPAATQGLGTISANNLQYYIVGKTMVAYGRFQAGTVDGNGVRLGLPAGYTVGNIAVNSAVGHWWRDNAVATTRKRGSIIGLTGDAFVKFGSDDYTAAASPLSQSVGSTLFANSDLISVVFTVPVNELSVSAYYGHEGVEFAADDGTNDVFGPNGALVPNVALGTGVTTRVFSFPSANQSTDAMIVEYNLNSLGWASVENLCVGISGQSSYSFGVRGYWQSVGVFAVEFGNGGLFPTGGLNANGSPAWATRFTAGDRFRIRKASSPALAGHSVATTAQPTGLYKAGAAPGVVGSAPITGCIGEVFKASIANTGVTTTASAQVTLTSLGIGTWALYLNANFNTGATVTGANIGISTSNNSYSSAAADAKAYMTGGSTLGYLGRSVGPFIVTLASPTTYYGVANTVGANAANGSDFVLTAVRIA